MMIQKRKSKALFAELAAGSSKESATERKLGATLDYKAIESGSQNYKSEIAAAVHEMMESFSASGVVDRQTMREFDADCLAPAELISPEEIRAIREREHVSQPVFARYLNVSKNLVSDWERGVKRPGGPALRLLSIVRKNGLRSIA